MVYIPGAPASVCSAVALTVRCSSTRRTQLALSIRSASRESVPGAAVAATAIKS
jgi:hypothetical protein